VTSSTVLSAADKAITLLRSEINAVQREEQAEFPPSHATDAEASGRKALMLNLVARHTMLIEQFRRLVAQEPTTRRLAAPAIAINVELRDYVAERTASLGTPGWQLAAYCMLDRGHRFLVDDRAARTALERSAKQLGVVGSSAKGGPDALTIALLNLYQSCQSAIGAAASNPARTAKTLDLQARAYRRLLLATERDRATDGRAAPAWSAFLRFVRLGDRIFALVARGGLHPPPAELRILKRLAPAYTAAGRGSDAATTRLTGTP
jgi:chemotaxis response regulator CheB